MTADMAAETTADTRAGRSSLSTTNPDLPTGPLTHRQIVTILLAAGADPRIGDRGGVTALQHATRRGHGEVARILRNA